ncbi:hypothetical protein BDQ94DRAFT_161179 [Aspergillus welwitschiae]|uniref:Zn(2)-C6 fungal-type domain-containing protein n=1 Tax=Aspergillus welwitschiae TaxID=1341132 RepID=A0A3F3PUT9_9EURO|nr:hypothetical protein BDQ94DRAFT_161179 [Aspergillus welwitschiae]RDH30694.1 hypothetical protein BDQ94DRAFT_161179 [Aspergillus welwitschiae]
MHRQHRRRHACARCIQLKVKCVPTRDSVRGTPSCERCMRLSQPCMAPETQGPGSHRKSRIDSLQEQVDNLVTQVALMKHNRDNSPPARSLNYQYRRNGDESDHNYNHGIQIRNSPSGADTDLDFISRGLFTLLECEELLAKFRLHKMVQFPFVIIPTHLGVPTLRRQFPFLLMCTITACLEHKASLQHGMEQEVREFIATRLVINSERSLDLLLGLLVHVAWNHYHWHIHDSQASMFLQMAVMIVVDLGLDKGNFAMQASPPISWAADQHEKDSSCWISTAQRAFLGCYYLCSRSLFFRGQLAMRHTEWIKRCTEVLAQKAEYPSDVLLGVYIKEYTLCETNRSLVLEHFQGADKSMAWKELSESLALQQRHTEGFLRRSNLWDNWAVRIELSATSMLVLGRHKSIHHDNVQRLQALCSSAHDTINNFLAMPSPALAHLPASSYNILWYSLLLLSRLRLLFHAQPKISGIKRHDIHTLGLALMKKMEGHFREGDALTNCKNVLRSMLVWLENDASEQQQGQVDLSARGSEYEHESTRLHHSGHPEGDRNSREAALWGQMLEDLDWLEGPSCFVVP